MMMTAALIYFAVWNITYFAIGLPLLPMDNPLILDLIISLEELIACLLLTSMLVLLAMFVSTKISAGVLSILLSLTLLFFGVFLKTRLNQPEFIEESSITLSEFEEGNSPQYESVESKMVSNPKFIPEGPQRDALIFLENISVGAQLIDVNDNHEVGILWYVLFDNAMIILICCAGSHLFGRKDIN